MQTTRRGFFGLLAKTAAAVTVAAASSKLELVTGKRASEIEELARDDAFRVLRDPKRFILPKRKLAVAGEQVLDDLDRIGLDRALREGPSYLAQLQRQEPYLADILRQADHAGRLCDPVQIGLEARRQLERQENPLSLLSDRERILAEMARRDPTGDRPHSWGLTIGYTGSFHEPAEGVRPKWHSGTYTPEQRQRREAKERAVMEEINRQLEEGTYEG